jgi:VCBS repeat-containing protein
LNADGGYSYTPQAGYVGQDTFTYTASAGGATSDPVLVTITMTNTQPLAEGEAQSTHMGDFELGKILVVDPEGDPFTMALVTTTTHGTLTFYPNGDYMYQPEAGYVGPDSFTYSAVDNQIGAEPAQGTVTIDVTNTLPVVKDETLTTHMGAAVVGTIADNISDPEDDPFTVGLQTTTTHGTLTVNPNGTYTYQPQAGYVGPDSFTISAWDEQIGAEPIPATVTITVTNTQPNGVSDSAVTTYVSPVVIGVLRNDSDPDKDPLTVGSFSYTGAGTVVLNANGTFTYTPPAGFLGKDSFTYSVSDGQLGAELTETTVIITVNIGRLPPPESFMPTGPDLDKADVKTSGCPALMKWAAKELGVDERTMAIWMVNGLASSRDIQPCEACASLREAATILSDTKGTHIAALAQVIREFASSAGPPTEEQMASIADAIGRYAKSGNRYAVAGEYLAALAEYVSILSTDMGFSPEESVQLAAVKYVNPLAKGGNADAAPYVTARLSELSVFLSLQLLEPLQPSE